MLVVGYLKPMQNERKFTTGFIRRWSISSKLIDAEVISTRKNRLVLNSKEKEGMRPPALVPLHSTEILTSSFSSSGMLCMLSDSNVKDSLLNLLPSYVDSTSKGTWPIHSLSPWQFDVGSSDLGFGFY